MFLPINLLPAEDPQVVVILVTAVAEVFAQAAVNVRADTAKDHLNVVADIIPASIADKAYSSRFFKLSIDS